MSDNHAPAVYVFEGAGSSFTYDTALTAGALPAYSWFGLSVAISNGRIVVGARGDTNASNVATGAVYVFERVQGAWSQTAKIVPGDGVSGDGFGNAVAATGDRIVVGSPFRANYVGAVYVVDRSPSGQWSQTAELTASDGATSNELGVAVAVDSGRVLAGAPNAGSTGAAYVFDCSSTGCAQSAKLVPNETVTTIEFGSTVALLGSRALIGAPNFAGYFSLPIVGRAIVFELSGSAWQKTADWALGQNDARFGSSVALGPNRAVVGNPYDSDFIQPNVPGAAVVYDLGASGWTTTATLYGGAPFVTMAFDFGGAVALDGNTIVGGPMEINWSSSTSAGTAAVAAFDLGGPAPVPASSRWISLVLAAALLAMAAVLPRGRRRGR